MSEGGDGVLLVVNAGSSSLKFRGYQTDGRRRLDPLFRGQVEGIGPRPRLTVKDAADATLDDRALAQDEARDLAGALAVVAGWLTRHADGRRLMAVGHRVVHGGMQHVAPARVDAALLDDLDRLVSLAPLHQPHNLAVIRAVAAHAPEVPQVACFDTAFHRGRPPLADLFAIPYALTEQGILRYGFHGLSYEHIARILPRAAPEIARGRVIAAHLGSGASLCAIADGKAVDATMGFTALDGLPMGTRTGQIDPGVLLYLLGEGGMTLGALEALLYRQSGLLGISGVSNDMRDLLASDAPRARLAVDYFVARIAREIGALTAVLGGLDGLVFTAGIGERSIPIRARVVAACAWLGMTLDPAANAAGGPCITTAASRVSAWVIPTDEEGMIARHTLDVLNRGTDPQPGGLTDDA